MSRATLRRPSSREHLPSPVPGWLAVVQLWVHCPSQETPVSYRRPSCYLVLLGNRQMGGGRSCVGTVGGHLLAALVQLTLAQSRCWLSKPQTIWRTVSRFG